MKKIYRWLLSVTLATFLVASVGEVALAKVWNEAPLEKLPDAVGITQRNSGQTAVGVRVVKTDVSTISYEIPLFVACAATQSGNTLSLTFPSEYSIRNRSLNADGTSASIGVTGLKISLAEKNSSWHLVDDNEELTKPGDIRIKLGDRALPSMALSASNIGDVSLNVQNYLFGNNDRDDKTYNPILSELKIPLSGEIFWDTQLSDQSAVPIFKISYTLSFLDENNRVIGTAYEEGAFT